MSKFFSKMRYNKQLLIAFIFGIINLCFVVAVTIFDIVQVILVLKNSVNLTELFKPLNIALIIVVCIDLLIASLMFVVKVIKGKKNEFKKS